ncbi:RWD domain-containing protein [Cordyceps javanica]|uniref:RWD domain-containing protein n=1 Tax=Cordyceps javanica TaxID=43265 RepID=A0A545UVN7_9HYPO|nr:RWD domain-containing protein [Cordyceps javanica]TQW05136.1 RWD domain-containing protein [Cordyceps javanica]
MSDELRDEVEAINSIYGEASLVPAGDQDDGGDYILQLPGDAGSSLQLRFPSGYPETGGAPSVLGVQHSSGGVRGAGARDVRLFRAALGAVYQEGAVCLFDAVEDFSRRLEEEVQQQQQQMEEADGAAAEDADADEGDQSQDQGVNRRRRPRNDDADAEEEELDAAALAALPPPPWTVSEPVVEGKSTFVARVAAVSSPAQARRYVAQLLAGDRRVRSATHNITAWRVRGAAGTGSGTGSGAGAGAAVAVSYQDCDDDGEDAAGGRLLHLMQLMGLWDAMVVVTRWYGGVRLGPRRFALINAVARDAFVRAGMVPEGPGGGGGSGGSGKGKKR